MVDLLHYNSQYAAPFRALMGRKKRSENLEDMAPTPCALRGKAINRDSFMMPVAHCTEVSQQIDVMGHSRQQVEGLQAHRNPLRQTGTQLPGLCLPDCRACMVDLMSLDPSSEQYKRV
jgi:hypothetical protein